MSSDDDGDEEFEVESILKERNDYAGKFYLVRWKVRLHTCIFLC